MIAASVTPARLLELQRDAGNQAVGRMLAREKNSVAASETDVPALPKVDVTFDKVTHSYLVTVGGAPVARVGLHGQANAELHIETTPSEVRITLRHHGDAELMREDPRASLAVTVTLSEVDLKDSGLPPGTGPHYPAQPATVDAKATAPLLIGPPDSLRWPDEGVGEGQLKASLPPGSLGDFEMELRDGTKAIKGVVYDPDNPGEVIGYEVYATTGVTRLVDREGNEAYLTEVGLEQPPVDPIDLIPTPGTAAKGVGVVGKVGLKLLGKKAAVKGASMPLAVLMRLRSVSKALLARSARKAAAEAASIVTRITEEGLAHSFDRHAAQWFGRNVTRQSHMRLWRELVERTARSGQVFAWSLREFPTVARLAYIDGKPFVVQFFRESGELATAFVPNAAQLREMMRLVRLAK